MDKLLDLVCSHKGGENLAMQISLPEGNLWGRTELLTGNALGSWQSGYQNPEREPGLFTTGTSTVHPLYYLTPLVL